MHVHDNVHTCMHTCRVPIVDGESARLSICACESACISYIDIVGVSLQSLPTGHYVV